MALNKNMGQADRVIRLLVAVVIFILYFTGVISGTVGIILGLLGLILAVTATVSVCPLYLPFGLSTRKKTEGA
jgi:hypothetical protein